MKKLFLLCLIAVAAAFVSCSKEDGDVTINNENLVGRWLDYKNILERDGEIRIEDDYEDEVHHIYEFKADGTGSEVFMEKIGGEWYGEEETNFTYTLHENELYIREKEYFDDGVSSDYLRSYSLTIETLTANELVFFEKYDNGGKMQTVRYFLRRI